MNTCCRIYIFIHMFFSKRQGPTFKSFSNSLAASLFASTRRDAIASTSLPSPSSPIHLNGGWFNSQNY